MPIVSVERPHKLGTEEAVRRARDVVEEFGHRLNATVKWKGSDATFSGTGFSGSANVKPESVKVTVDLGLMLTPLKGKIETRLAKALEEKFA